MEVFFLHPLESSFGPFLAFFQGSCCYKDIIHVDDEPSFNNHVSEGGVHKCLEGWWGAAFPKGHDCGFIEAVGSDECSFPLVSFLYVNVVIPPLNINLGEVFGSLQFVDEGGDEGRGVHVSDSMFIKISIVLARMEFSIFL